MPKTNLTTSRRPRKDETAVDRIPLPDEGAADWFDAPYPGLALRVSRGGRRTWCHLYRFGGKQRRRSLGTYPAMSLEEARSSWNDDRKTLRAGLDPEGERRRRADEAAAERAAAKTFRESVEDYYQRYQLGEQRNKSADRRAAPCSAYALIGANAASGRSRRGRSARCWRVSATAELPTWRAICMRISTRFSGGARGPVSVT